MVSGYPELEMSVLEEDGWAFREPGRASRTHSRCGDGGACLYSPRVYTVQELLTVLAPCGSAAAALHL